MRMYFFLANCHPEYHVMRKGISVSRGTYYQLTPDSMMQIKNNFASILEPEGYTDLDLFGAQPTDLLSLTVEPLQPSRAKA